MIGLIVPVLAGGAVGTVSFSGATISDATVAPDTAKARVEFRADGTYWKNEGGVETQLGDWIDPKLRMSIFQVRFTNRAGSVPTSSTAAEDVWHVFRDGDFHVEYSPEGVGSVDIQIRLGENAVLDTATFELSAIVT